MNSERRHEGAGRDAELAEIQALARRLEAVEDLDGLVRLSAGARFVCPGEASHGTQEYYRWRALLWFPRTAALRPLHHEYLPDEPELETEPTGF